MYGLKPVPFKMSQNIQIIALSFTATAGQRAKKNVVNARMRLSDQLVDFGIEIVFGSGDAGAAGGGAGETLDRSGVFAVGLFDAAGILLSTDGR